MTAPLRPEHEDTDLDEDTDLEEYPTPATADATKPGREPRIRKFKNRDEWRDHMEKLSSGSPGKQWRTKNWIPD